MPRFMGLPTGAGWDFPDEQDVPDVTQEDVDLADEAAACGFVLTNWEFDLIQQAYEDARRDEEAEQAYSEYVQAVIDGEMAWH